MSIDDGSRTALFWAALYVYAVPIDTIGRRVVDRVLFSKDCASATLHPPLRWQAADGRDACLLRDRTITLISGDMQRPITSSRRLEEGFKWTVQRLLQPGTGTDFAAAYLTAYAVSSGRDFSSIWQCVTRGMRESSIQGRRQAGDLILAG